MPIQLTPIEHGDLCHGSAWTVENDNNLSYHIARVALGQSWHIQKILAGATMGPPPTSANATKDAIRLLTVQGTDPWHRDGWMFQVMSWIAAVQAAPNEIIRSPHMILAHKGFDGLQLKLNDKNDTVVAAVIFEDKATENPRSTIREEVWPEFAALEAGDRENVLVAEVVSLLRTRPNIDPDVAIQNILWSNARHYRVSITVGDFHATHPGRHRLFKDYDTVAIGSVSKRQAETFHKKNLREWMANLANLAIAAIHAEVPQNV